MLWIILITTLLFTWLTWKQLHAGACVLVALLPSYLLRIEILGIPTTLLECLVISFLLVWTIKRANVWKQKGFWDKRTWTLIAPMLIVSTISIVISPNFVAALGVWKAYFIEPILLFLVFRYELTNGLSQNNIYKALGISAIVLSLLGLIQWITGLGLPIPWDIERRITSVFNYPNALGLFLGPITIIGVLKLKESPVFWGGTSMLSLIAITLAKSEAALVSIAATLFLAGVWHKTTRVKTVLASILGTIIVIVSPWRNFVIEKLTLQDYSGGIRLSQWSETLNMLKDHWVLGAGLSGYPEVFTSYHLATHIEIFQYPHNLLLNIWVELGILGVVAMGILAYYVWQKRQEPHVFIPFLVLIQMCIHGLVDVPYFKNDLAILTWIFLAMIFTYAGQKTSSQQKKALKKTNQS